MRFSEQHMQGEYSYGVSGLVCPSPAGTHEDQAVLDFVSRLIALSS